MERHTTEIKTDRKDEESAKSPVVDLMSIFFFFIKSVPVSSKLTLLFLYSVTNHFTNVASQDNVLYNG
jgi:hypothetical protein